MREENTRLSAQLPDEEANDPLGRLLRLSGGPSPVPEDVALRVKSAVKVQWKQAVRARLRRRLILSAAVTAAASLFLYFLAWQFLIGNVPQRWAMGFVESLSGKAMVSGSQSEDVSGLSRGEILMTGSTIQSRESGRVLVRMLNGATIRMNFNSRLQLTSDSSVFLDHGTVYVDCKSADRPVQLVTPLGTIIDQGTQYEVLLKEEAIRIRVREGSVVLLQQGISRNVPAGKELTVYPAGKASMEDIAVYGSQWEWVSQIRPVFHIEGRSLWEFLKWITRENGWKLQFSGPLIRDASAGIILHGSVRDLPMDQMLNAVLSVTGLDYTLVDGVLMIEAGRRN